MLRKIIRSNPFLYKIWFKNVRNSKTNLPKENDLFFFTGFPRSGNTYLTNLMKLIFPSLNFSHLLHTIASIKLAMNIKIPVFVIVRAVSYKHQTLPTKSTV